jgi:hypothetical protein
MTIPPLAGFEEHFVREAVIRTFKGSVLPPAGFKEQPFGLE